MFLARTAMMVFLENKLGLYIARADGPIGGDLDIPAPVGSRRQTDTTRADRQGEDLANDDPGAGSPGGGEEEDEDGDEGDLGVDGGHVVGQRLLGGERVGVGVVEADRDADDGDEELADQHAQGTPDEDGAAAEALDGPEGNRGREDVDQREDQGHQEDVLDGARGLQEGGRVVKKKVDTSPAVKNNNNNRKRHTHTKRDGGSP